MPPELYVKFPRFIQMLLLLELPLYDYLPDEARAYSTLVISQQKNVWCRKKRLAQKFCWKKTSIAGHKTPEVGRAKAIRELDMPYWNLKSLRGWKRFDLPDHRHSCFHATAPFGRTKKSRETFGSGETFGSAVHVFVNDDGKAGEHGPANQPGLHSSCKDCDEMWFLLSLWSCTGTVLQRKRAERCPILPRNPIRNPVAPPEYAEFCQSDLPLYCKKYTKAKWNSGKLCIPEEFHRNKKIAPIKKTKIFGSINQSINPLIHQINQSIKRSINRWTE